MSSLLLYLLKSTASLGVFYLLFRLLMRRETNFALSRGLLLALVFASMIVPLVQLPQVLQPLVKVELIPDFSENRIQLQNISEAGPLTQPEENLPVEELTPESNLLDFSLPDFLMVVYCAGVMLSLLLLVKSIASVLLIFRKASFRQMLGYRLYITEKETPSFAFGRSVVISLADYEQHGEAILAHEQAHIRLNHFYDLFLLDLVKIIHWFNPAIYGLIRDMKEIHEFQADVQTLDSGIDSTQYQLLIIQKGVGPRRFALANSFNHCQIKKRITMMNKSKTSKAWRWKVATFMPLLALLLMAFGKTGENDPLKSNIQKEILVSNQTSQNQVELGKRLIEIKKDGYYIDNKQISLEAAVNKAKEWASSSNDWIHLQIDESVPNNSIDEIREKMYDAGAIHVTQSTGNSDEIMYPAGDVSELAKFSQGKWRDWMESQLNHFLDSKSNDLEYKIIYSYIVDKKGKAGNGHIIKGCEYPEINEAMEKVLAQIPDWKPARRGGEAVNVVCREMWSRKIYVTKDANALPPPIFIDIKKDGIYVMKELVKIDELKMKLTILAKNNPKSEFWVKIGIGISQDQIESLKEIIHDSGISNAKYSTDIKEKDYPIKN